MAVTYLSGQRVQGTEAEIPVIETTGKNTVDTTSVTDYTILRICETSTLTISSGSGSADYIVCGGGGAGGSASYNGGGGAGAFNSGTLTMSAGDYTATIGSGGVAISEIGPSANGGTSSFNSTEAQGGGGGASHHATDGNTVSGATGGSGGGGAVGSGSGGGSGTLGNNGSAGGPWTSPYESGGGGGGGKSGAGGAVVTGAYGHGGNGGAGIADSITGTSLYYCGGGGGSASGNNTTVIGGTGGSSVGGYGGRVDSNRRTHPKSAVPNTGSGGGGGGGNAYYLGGNGSDGVVILKFATSGNVKDTNWSISPDTVEINANLAAGTQYESTDERKFYQYGNNSLSLEPVSASADSKINMSVDGTTCTKTDGDIGAAWSYQTFSPTGAITYSKNGGATIYTSAITSGTFYAWCGAGGSSGDGNSYTVTYDDTAETLTWTVNQDESSAYGNKYLGLNIERGNYWDQNTAGFYIDNATDTAIRESGTNVETSPSGSVVSGDYFTIHNIKQNTPLTKWAERGTAI